MVAAFRVAPPRTMQPPALLCSALALSALLAGCLNTPSTRIREHAALFATLQPYTQEKIRAGLVDYSYGPEMIYMALGRPNRRTVTATPDGPVEVWTYRNFVCGGASASRLGINNPGTRYQGGTIMSPNAPSIAGGPQSPGLGSTAVSRWSATLNDSGAPVATLMITLRGDSILEIRLQR